MNLVKARIKITETTLGKDPAWLVSGRDTQGRQVTVTCRLHNTAVAVRDAIRFGRSFTDALRAESQIMGGT